MRPNVEKLAEAAMGAQDPDYFSCATIALATYVQALEEERDALRKDAERYRWLRDEAWGCDKRGRLDVHVCQFGPGVLMSAVTELAEEALDEAIDAAIAAKEPK